MDPNMSAQEMVYGEIEDFAGDMMAEKPAPDYLVNRAKPENLPGSDPSEPGVTLSDDEMGLLEEQYGCATDPTNY